MDNLEIAKKLFIEAIECVEKNQLEEAEIKFLQAHLLAPERESILINTIKVQLSLNKTIEAKNNLVLYEKNGHKDTIFFEEIADKFYILNELNLSKSIYIKILEQNHCERILEKLFLNLVSLNDYETIIKYEHLAKKESTNLQNFIGIAYAEIGNYEKTKKTFELIWPEEIKTKLNYALALIKLKKNAEAEEILQWVINNDISNKNGYIALSKIYQDRGDIKKAIKVLEECIPYCKDDPDIYINLSHYYIANYEYEKVIILDKSKNSNLKKEEKFLVNKSIALFKLKKYNDAMLCINDAIEINVNSALAWLNKGAVLNELNQYTEAENCYIKALAINKNFHEATWNLSLIKLKQKKIEIGFEYFEARWLRENADPYWHKHLKVLKKNNYINNKNILIWSEQGYGDSIQFCRYIKNLEKFGANIYIEVEKPLYELFRKNFGKNVMLRGEWTQDLGFDFEIPMLSLPKFLNVDDKKIKIEKPYLIADESKVADFKKILINNDKKNIAIAVSGNKLYDAKNGNKRPIPLKFFENLSKDFNLYLLQKEIRTEDLIYLDKNKRIVNCDKFLYSFDDTAAILKNMDHVVTIDTSLAHLAGAMGLKTEVLLPWCSDWRWFVEETQSSWYYTVNLWRQKQIGNWDIIKDVEERLKICYVK